jgi:hypothetical protein
MIIWLSKSFGMEGGFWRLVGDTERRLTFNASDDETDDDSYNSEDEIDLNVKKAARDVEKKTNTTSNVWN